MGFPATAALEKFISSPERDTKTDRLIVEPQRSPTLDTFDMSFLGTLVSTVDQNAVSTSPIGFPLIEWSAVNGNQSDETTSPFSQSCIALNGSESFTTSKEAYPFLDKLLAGESNRKIRSGGISPLQNAAGRTNDDVAGTRGRLVRSIALGSRLALLDTPIDVISESRFRHSRSSYPRSTTCTYG